LAAANTIKTCCDAVGISERVYFEWCERHLYFLADHNARAAAREDQGGQSDLLTLLGVTGARRWPELVEVFNAIPNGI
jgi:hypothetical protein